MSGPLSDVLEDPSVRVVVCCGAGGVGKTTTAAALGVRAARQGRRVVVLTIDPSRRLAQALGADPSSSEPHPVTGLVGDGSTGSLDVLVLDMRRTFDDLVRQHAGPHRAAAILGHPLYESLSTSLAGTQEYMAVERIGQLREEMTRTGRWDLLVVDTPPSRSALEFLDAPARLGRFLDGRLLRVLSAPARAGGRLGRKVAGQGVALGRGVVSAVLGPSLVGDVQTLLGALDTVLGGFRERADATYAALTSPTTAWVVVGAPDDASVVESRRLLARLADDEVRPRALVVNRVVRATSTVGTGEALAAADAVETDLGRAALAVHVERTRRARRHASVLRTLRDLVADEQVPVVVVPDSPHDADDVQALDELAHHLVR